MRKKRLLIGLMILGLLFSVTACSSKGEDQDTSKPDTSQQETTLPTDEKELGAKNIMEEFKELTSKEDVNLDSIAAFMKENIQNTAPEEAVDMILTFEELQIQKKSEVEEKFVPETVQQTFTKLAMEGGNINEEDSIKEDTVKRLVLETKNSGYKIEQAEGYYFPVIDYSFYKQFSSFATDDIKDYVDIMAMESDDISSRDAALVISWDEVIKRAISFEAFIDKYPASKRINEVKELYQKYEFITMHGLNNTPLFDYESNRMVEDAKKAFGIAMARSIDSDYLKKLGKFMEIAAKNNYKLTDDVEEYRKTNTNYGDSSLEETNRYYAAGIDDVQELEDTFELLKQALADGDKDTFADYIAYPIKVNLNGEKTELKDKDEFIRNFNQIITDDVKNAFLNQKVDETFVNYQGVMVGQGQLWFNQIEGTKHKYSIYGINN